MKKYTGGLFIITAVIFISFCISGCQSMPLKEGGLEISKDTLAGIDDIGVGRVTRQF